MKKHKIVIGIIFCCFLIGLQESWGQQPVQGLTFYVPNFKHSKQINPMLAKKVKEYFVDAIFSYKGYCNLINVLIPKVVQKKDAAIDDTIKHALGGNKIKLDAPLVPKKADALILGFIEYDPFSNETIVYVYLCYKDGTIISRGVNLSNLPLGKLELENISRATLLQPITDKIFQRYFLIRLFKMVNNQMSEAAILDCLSRTNRELKPIPIPDSKNYKGPPIQLTLERSIPLQVETALYDEQQQYVLFLCNKNNRLYKYIGPVSKQQSITKLFLSEYDKVITREETQLVIAKIAQTDYDMLRKKQAFNISYWKKENIPSLEIIQRIPLFIHVNKKL